MALAPLTNRECVRAVAKILVEAEEFMRDASDDDRVAAFYAQLGPWLHLPQIERLGEVVMGALVESHPQNQHVRNLAALYLYGVGRPVEGQAIGRGVPVEPVETWSDSDELKRGIAVGKFGVELKEGMDLAVRLAEKNRSSK